MSETDGQDRYGEDDKTDYKTDFKALHHKDKEEIGKLKQKINDLKDELDIVRETGHGRGINAALFIVLVLLTAFATIEHAWRIAAPLAILAIVWLFVTLSKLGKSLKE